MSDAQAQSRSVIRFDAAVVGAGPAGLAAALGLAATGLNVVIVDSGAAEPVPAASKRDFRTAALFGCNINLLHNLGVWPLVAAASAPLRAIRIVDAGGTLLRAPEILFRAQDLGLTELGWNIPNAALVQGLASLARGSPRIEVQYGAPVVGVDVAADHVVLRLQTGRSVLAGLVVGADGRRSICRAAAGITVRTWPYDQTAVIARFEHSRSHDDVSTELHCQAGPCTTVPLPGRQSSLVWVERPAVAARLATMAPASFRAALEDRLDGLLGTLGEPVGRATFPLSGLTADHLARNRVALVGEAAHVMPPIGAQGLNAGLSDVAALVDVVGQAFARGDDVGSSVVLAAYAATRDTDIKRRISAIDVLNRSLTSSILPVSLLRGAGLHALAALPSLRRRLMREGLAPPGPLPPLQRAPTSSVLDAGGSTELHRRA